MANDPIYIPGSRKVNQSTGGGGTGDGNLVLVVKNFDFSSSSPLSISNVESGDVVLNARIDLSAAFDAAAQLSIGHTGLPEMFLKTADVDAQITGTYEGIDAFTYSGNNTVYLYITPNGASTGTGKAYIYIKKS